VVSPADATVYYYMEGMNAPMGAFRNYGQRPTAVAITDRSLQENEPGVYTSQVKWPVAGTYDVAFMTETPEVLHCFSMAVAPDPTRATALGPLGVEYLNRAYTVEANETHRLRFRLTNPANGEPQRGLGDVSVAYYQAPTSRKIIVPATKVETVVYEASLRIARKGAYYAYIQAPSRGVKLGDIPFITLRTATARDRIASASSVQPPENLHRQGQKSVTVTPSGTPNRGG